MRVTHCAKLYVCLLTLALAACQEVPVTRPSLISRDEDNPPAPPPPPTAGPGETGLPSTRLEWEWQEDARPSALAADGDRLGVIVSDGRFLWLDAETGLATGGGFLWPDDIRGETWGSVTIASDMAIVKAAETFQSELGDFPETRSRVVAFDAEGDELWTLPELGDKHLYSATIGQGKALIGTHRGFTNNSLSAYDLDSGEIEWRYEAEDYGFEKLVANEQHVYGVLLGAESGGIAAYDLDTGALIWAEHDPAVNLVDDLLLEGERLYVLTQPAAIALRLRDGQIDWSVEMGLAPEAGMVARETFLYVVPAPTAGMSNRPGLLGVNAEDGEIAWHALAGLVADPLAASGEALWAIVKDPDEGVVSLSVLEAASGLERARLTLGHDLEVNYRLVADGDTVYVLGESLRAYRIPRE
jgi:outer membrane protein assembly factor BamB